MSLRVSLDVETYSEAELKQCGAWRYAEDPTTELLCAAVAVNDDEPRLWLPGDPFPVELEYADTIHAWNAEFEFAIWKRLARRYGWPAPDPAMFRCTMSLAMSFNLPAKLEQCALVLGAIHQKDPRGARLIQKLCKPRSRTSKENAEPRWTPRTAPDDFRDFYDYNKQDVRTEHAVELRLPRKDLPEFEQRVYLESLLANARGITIDQHGVALAIAGVERYSLKLENRFREITGGIGSRQLAPFQTWLYLEGCPLPNLQAETVREALDENILEIDDAPREALQIRQSVGQVAVKKLWAMQRSVCTDSRIRGLLQYHGAGTGRYAGRLVQLQNLKRPDEETGTKTDLAAWVESPSAFDPEVLELLGDPMNYYGAFVRPLLTAAPGQILEVGDFNAIECRVLAWLAGEQWLLDLFAENAEVYAVVASHVFGREITKERDPLERDIGKRIELGCGYQMGGAKFAATCRKYGVKLGGEWVTVDFAERAVDGYRETHPNVKALWYAAQDAAIEAVDSPGVITRAGKLEFYASSRWLQMKLPSGRKLSYCMPRLVRGPMGWQLEYQGVSSYTKQWSRQHTYGGRLIENATQAVARDLCVEAIVRLVEHGYSYLFSSHDEIICEIPWLNANNESYCRVMAERPTWADGLPIKVEGWSGTRYRK